MSIYYQLLSLDDNLNDWDKTVQTAPYTSIYSSSVYLRSLSLLTQANITLLAIKQNHQIIGGLPLVGTLLGKHNIMMANHLLYYLAPFTVRDKGMSNTSYERRSQKVMQQILAYLNNKAFDKVFIKYYQAEPDTRLLSADNWQFIPSHTYRVNLSSEEAIFEQFAPNIRRIIRQTAANNWQFNTNGSFDDFYVLHEQNMQKHQKPPYLEKAAFKQLVNDLQQQNYCCLCELRDQNGQLLSSQLVLTGPFSISHTLCAATAHEHKNSGASTMLRWRVFKHLCQQGYNVNDLTDAHEATVARYKQQLGGQLHLSLIAHKTFSPYLQLRDAIKQSAKHVKQLLS